MGERAAEILRQGLAEHQAGRLARAERIYRDVLRLDPTEPDALHLLGLVAHQSGHHEAAIGLIQSALARRPQVAVYRNNLGEALRALGRYSEAADHYRAALALEPGYVDALVNLGIVLARLGAREEAMSRLHAAIERDPQHPLAHLNLGVLLQEQGQRLEAEAAYRRALEVEPTLAEAHNNRGTLLAEAGRLEEAVACFHSALRERPDYADALANLGNTLHELGRTAEARDAFGAAARLAADPIVLARLGDMLDELGTSDEARTALTEFAQGTKSAASGDWLVRLRAALVCPTIFPSRDAILEYRASLEQALDRLLDERPTASFGRLLRSSCQVPFRLQFHGLDELPTRRRLARLFESSFPPTQAGMERRPKVPGGIPFIGIIVTPRHEASFAKSLLGLLNGFQRGAARIAIVGATRSATILRPLVTHPDIEFIELPSRLEEAPALLARAGFDLVYYWEIGTDSLNYFLPFFRLAPVQASSWGIQLTSGIPTMDEYLSSRLVEPANAAAHYSERLVLRESLLTWQDPPGAPADEKSWQDWRRRFGFARREVVYLCAQQLGKFHPDFDAVLFEILSRDGSGLVVVTEDRFSTITDRLRRRIEAGLGPDRAGLARRIRWLPRQAGAAYFGLLAAADVLLDPIHFGGVNTTLDGLALGKPIVTWPSPYQRGRFTLGSYRRLGLGEEHDWVVAPSVADYAAVAAHLGSEPDMRQMFARLVAERRANVFQDEQAIRETQTYFIERAMAGRMER